MPRYVIIYWNIRLLRSQAKEDIFVNLPLKRQKYQPQILSHLGLFTAAAIWASTFINIKYTLLQVQPNTLAFLRFLLATIALGLVCLLKKQRLVAGKDWLWASLSGLTGVTLYNFLQNQGLRYAGAVDSAILASLAPVFMAILARFVLKEKITRQQILGIFLAFFGSFLVATNGSLDFFQAEPLRLWGDFLIIFTGLAWGLYNTSLKKLLNKYSATSVLTSSTITGTVFLLPTLLLEMPLNLHTVNCWGWLNVIYLGLFASALAYLLWNSALTKVGTVTAGAYLYLMPVITTVMAFLFLNERPGLITIIGGFLALLGTYFAGR